MRIAVDFDGVLWNRHKGGIANGASKKLRQAKADGHEIIVWTARPDYTTFEIAELLDRYQVPYDFILGGKLYFDVFIDDHAKEFVGWQEDYW